MHIAEVVTIAKSLPLLRLNTYKSLILSYSADFSVIFDENPDCGFESPLIVPPCRSKESAASSPPCGRSTNSVCTISPLSRQSSSHQKEICRQPRSATDVRRISHIVPHQKRGVHQKSGVQLKQQEIRPKQQEMSCNPSANSFP